MTFRKLIALAGIGGLVYAHRKRGGQMTVESFKQSGHDLVEGIKSRAADLRAQAESRLDEVVGKAHEAGSNFASSRDVTGYGSSGYGYGDDSTNR